MTRQTSSKQDPFAGDHDRFPVIGLFVATITYLGYAVLISVGHLRDFCGTLTGMSRYNVVSSRKKGYGVLLKSWESFYTRRLYHRIQDCWNRPISSAPGAHIEVMERVSHDGNCTLSVTGKTTSCLNLASYNYLGFADDWLNTCGKNVLQTLHEWPVAVCASRGDLGSCSLHTELEHVVADFIGMEDAVVFTMGYGTNATTLPVLAGPGCLIISDSLNHTSLVNGSRATSAMIRVFPHNEPDKLEAVLRESVTKGQPKHHRPWNKILVVVEGIYSMEGAICHLKEMVAICKKYKAYIYVDEAHSIGALGKTGRGICEHAGVDPKDIDVLMGTFTKSFGGMGGYIAGSRALCNQLRSRSAGQVYHQAMSPLVCQQVITALKVIRGEECPGYGAEKLERLKDNSNFFRAEMNRIGLHVYGDKDSPIIPVMIYCPAKICAFSRECLKRGLAIVVVGFPATGVVLSRARFCISAGHSREDLKRAVEIIDEVTDLVLLKYGRRFYG